MKFDQVMKQGLIMLLFLLNLSYTETSATIAYVSPRGICTYPGDFYQLDWKAWNADSAESLQVYCEWQNGTRIAMDSYTSTWQKSDSVTFVLQAKLTVHSLTDGDFSSCECAVLKNGEQIGAVPKTSNATVWIRNDTMFSIFQDDILVSPDKEEFEVTFDVDCDFDGSFEVLVVRDNGDRRLLEHRHSPDLNGLPYIQLRAAELPMLHFPALSCRDTGLYRITYRASRYFKPVETIRDLRVHADDSFCPNEVDTTQNNPTAELLQPSKAPVPRKLENSGNTGLIVVAIVMGVLFVVSTVCALYLFFMNRQLRMRELMNRTPAGEDMIGQSMLSAET